jgi:RimJ/RimL family protein N-acetyltransferase
VGFVVAISEWGGHDEQPTLTVVLTFPLEVAGHGIRLRPLRPADAPAVAACRSDPETAAYQAWTTPYPLARAEAMIADMASAAGPVAGQWINVAIADQATDHFLGDVAVRLSDDERAAEVGYTLTPAARGRGVATVATGAVIDRLFADDHFHRVHATLHPDNVASASVLERLGFVHEGTDRQSYWVGDTVSDDARYGLLRADWEAWRARPLAPPEQVQLVEITPANASAVRHLGVHASQHRFVASVTESFADALVPEIIDGAPVVPWLRAVAADGELVAFVMLALATEHHPDPYLWRLLVDRRHQHRRIGSRILDLVVEECRRQGATRLLTSWVPGRGSPEGFYLGQGFTPTGAVVDGEIEGHRDI